MCNERQKASSSGQYQYILNREEFEHCICEFPDEETGFALWGFLGCDIASEVLEMVKPILQERRKVVLDLSAVHGIDSAGIAVLVECLRISSEMGKEFRIVGINKTVKEILDLVRLHTLFHEMEIIRFPGCEKYRPINVNRLNPKGAP